MKKGSLNTIADIPGVDESDSPEIREHVRANLKTAGYLLRINAERFRNRLPVKDGGPRHDVRWERTREESEAHASRRMEKIAALLLELHPRQTLIDPGLKRLREHVSLLDVLPQSRSSLNGKKNDAPDRERRDILRFHEMSPDEMRTHLSDCDHAFAEWQALKRRFTDSNVRLVISIAKKFKNRGLTFVDLIQEGNVGLMRAADKFDPERGYKFSTYATWWVKQSIRRAIPETAFEIRVPVHVFEVVQKMRWVIATLCTELQRKPLPKEIAARMGKSIDEVNDLMAAHQVPVSHSKEVNGTETSFGDLLPGSDDGSEIVNSAHDIFLRSSVRKVMNTIPERESMAIRLLYGLDGGRSLTLDEVGKIMGVSRERVRQISESGLDKLKAPYRKKLMEPLVPPMEEGNGHM